ncbi:VanZ family protein [Sporolactobacillus sp. CPB3-1]|uniref:VanZ family protein n=1 Tax=Sporolactobacillus mangiferae TaxID=2940498 RepID=A0ABT0MC62_9BACL|nr:VanZ family protein [Sporolactobacillus mangiferae]MCL1632442.1 VanZ family protein [Sporolactobacillus mangiferae]
MNHILNPTIFEFFTVYIILFGVCVLWEKWVRRTLTYNRGVFLSLFTGYMLLTLLLTVQPMSPAEWSIVVPGSPLVNLRPFRIITLMLQSVQGHWLLMWSIFLPIPFIFFVGFLRRGKIGFSNLFVTGFTASLIIEVMLYVMNHIPHFPKHLFDLDVLILNGFGVFLGCVLFSWMESKQWMKEYISETMSTK